MDSDKTLNNILGHDVTSSGVGQSAAIGIHISVDTHVMSHNTWHQQITKYTDIELAGILR